MDRRQALHGLRKPGQSTAAADRGPGPDRDQKRPNYKLLEPPSDLPPDNQITARHSVSSTRPKCNSVVTALTFETLSAYSF